jgi:2-hydroxy fatty acid dioxygenase
MPNPTASRPSSGSPSSASSSPVKPPTFLERSFTFYASYHDNFINQLIHIVCVWPIFWTAVLFFQYSPTLPGSEFIQPYLPDGFSVTYGFPLLVFYFFFYLLVELPGVVGPLCSLIVFFTYVTTTYVKNHYAEHEPWKLATVIHIVAWIAQFYGHGVHEGRSPALLDNLFGAIVMAPLFVTMEVAFFLGYKSKFRARVAALVKENIKQFKMESAKKKK